MTPWDAQAGHHFHEGGCVASLPGGQWPTEVVGREVDLRGQSTAGPTDGVVVRLVGRGPCLRVPAACW